jgi:hypothetical protein
VLLRTLDALFRQAFTFAEGFSLKTEKTLSGTVIALL